MDQNISATNASEDEGGGLHEITTVEMTVWFVLYSIVACLAVTGNGLVVYIILTRRKMKTVTNYFILNLAVADFITGLLAIPFKFQAALLQRWLLPDFMCQVVPFIETVSLSVSVFTLTMTAVDRFRSVFLPQLTKMQKNTAIFILISIWIVSIACSVPYGIEHKATLAPWDNTTLICCPCDVFMENWWRYYNIYLTIIQYFVPLLIINVAYIGIGYKVWFTILPVETIADSRVKDFERSKKKVIKMLVIVVTVFSFCWLPYETYLLLSELSPLINTYFYINVVFFSCHWLAMSNSCLNPIIYGVYNEKFTKEYNNIFRRVLLLKFDFHGAVSPKLRGIKNRKRAGLRLNEASPLTYKYHSNLVYEKRKSKPRVEEKKLTQFRDINPLGNLVCHTYIASELGHDDSDSENVI